MKKIIAILAMLGVLSIPAVAGSIPHVAEERRPDHAAEMQKELARAGDPTGVNAYSSIEELTKGAPRPFHEHGISTSKRGAGSQVGSYRSKSENVSVAYFAGCQGPIYQPMWQGVNGPGQSWVEIGTAHWCDGSRSWYGFNAVNFNPAVPTGSLTGGIWVFNTPITGTTTHGFHIQRASWSCNYWGLYVDSTLMGWANMGGCYIGTLVDVGLESYNTWAEVKGVGTRSTAGQHLFWDGAAALWWEQHVYEFGHLGEQMHIRTFNINGDAAHCQNWPAAECGV